MAGRHKKNDDEKVFGKNVQFTHDLYEKINNSEGRNFSDKLRKIILNGGFKMEKSDIYDKGFSIGKFHGLKIRTKMLQITDPSSSRDFRVNAILDICVLANAECPQFILDYLTSESFSSEYYTFLLGINNGMLSKEG